MAYIHNPQADKGTLKKSTLIFSAVANRPFSGSIEHDKQSRLLPRSAPALARYKQVDDWPGLPCDTHLAVFPCFQLFHHAFFANEPSVPRLILLALPNSLR